MPLNLKIDLYKPDKKKRKEKRQENIQELWGNMKVCNMHIIIAIQEKE